MPRLLSVHLGATYAFLYIPIAVLMVLSFNKSGLPASWGGFSFEWYGKLATNPKILASAWNSVIVATISTLIATAIGTLLAIGVERSRPSAARDALLFAPMIIPDVVLAIALLSFFTLVKFTLGLHSKDGAVTNLLASLANKSPSPLAREVAKYAIAAAQPPKLSASASKAKPLTADEQKRFEAGKGLYEQACLACHQAHGHGQPGVAPPLAESEWVGMTDRRLIRIVLHGLRGKIKVKGEEYEIDMPSLGVLDDDQIAAVLTYVRREWGHGYAPVAPETVKQVRKETEDREDAWTSAELLRIK